MEAIIIIILIAVFRVLLRHAMFDEIKHSMQQRKDNQQPAYKRTSPKIKLSPLETLLNDANQAVKASPRNPNAYSDRGAVYILFKQYNDAMADLNKAIKLNPSCADALNNRAVLRYHQNDFQAALDDMNEAISCAPENAFYYLNRSTIYRRFEDSVKAETDIGTALDLNLKVVDTADKANLKHHVVNENIIWNRALARMVFLKTELLFVKCGQREYLTDNSA